MKTFKICITETLSRTLEIEADNLEDAIASAQEQYYNSEIVLDYNDYVDVDFNEIKEG